MLMKCRDCKRAYDIPNKESLEYKRPSLYHCDNCKSDDNIQRFLN